MTSIVWFVVCTALLWLDLHLTDCGSSEKELIGSFLKAIGRLRYGVPTLKRMLLFVHLDAVEVTLVKQVRLLARRQQALEKHGIPHAPCTLDHMVHRGLLKQGRSFAHGTWRFYGFSFTLGQRCNSADWGPISPWIRDSIRRKHFEQFFSSKRHEMVGQNIPCNNADRMALARKWIKGDSVAVLLATGSIASAASRFNGQPEAEVKCPKCKGSNVNWHHYWECWLGLDPPADLLFRSILWPRAEYVVTLSRCGPLIYWNAMLKLAIDWLSGIRLTVFTALLC